ncbi:efflux transporter outer membrane subunit [Burkholderia gladioli]|uniref:efflux transporter outer membrane subunit n=1 Tax=Burkholderia gladioli TaxID=28095 RepID=UPI00164219CF|nr:efflux transporter outer membrane subunit [Burkholderia gladioli]
MKNLTLLLPSLCLALTALSGCTVGPDYKVPKDAKINSATAVGTFVGSNAFPEVTNASVPGGWWHLYQSRDLNTLIDKGLSENANIRIAQANLRRSQAITKLARTQGQPKLGFEGTYQRALLSAESYLSPEEHLPPDNLYDVSLSASYELDLFGRIRRGVEAAKADEQAVAAARDWVRVTVAAGITKAYLQVCADGEALAVVRHSVDIQERSLQFTQRLQREGRATRFDIERSAALLNQIQSTVPTLEARRRNALFQLAVLSGRPPAEFDERLTQCVDEPPIRSAIPVGDGAALLRRRPDVRVAERELEAATARIGVATADLYPRIILKAGIGTTGLTSDFAQHSTNEWSIGPFVSWQFNQNPARAKIAAANAEQQARLAHFDQTVLQALRDVEVALNNYHHDLEREGRLEAARDHAANAASDAHEIQLAGRESDLDTLDAERVLVTAERALSDQKAMVSQDQVALFLALGGGWEAHAEQEPNTAGASVK